MKQLATIGVVVVLLIGAALYYSSLQNRTTDPTPTSPIATPTPTPPKDGTPLTTAESTGTLTLRAAISNGYLLANNSREIFAAVDINAMEYKGSKRPALNVAVVLDRSGSMSGAKIENAKLAARRLVNVLEDGDRIAIVSYGSDVSLDFRSEPINSNSRMRLLRAINAIEIGGGTNLSGGFQMGFNEVNRHKTDETVNRVILMSDGHANVGITDERSLVGLSKNSLQSKISVTTLGVGLDYNEDLMTQMADQGAGNYYFVDQPSTTVSIFEKELKGLATTVARNSVAVIKLKPGVVVDRVFGFPFKQSGNQVWITLSEFHSSQSKNILMKLRAHPTATGDLPIMDVDLSYDDLVNSKPGHQTVALKSVVTNDAAKADTGVDVAVISRVQQVEVAETMKDAMKMYEEGKAEEAQRRITRTQNTMRERQTKYKLKGAKRFEAADKELDQLKYDVGSAAPASAEGKRMRKQKKARSRAILLDTNSF